MWQSDQPRFILASASHSRARLLQQAGLFFDIIPSLLEEGELKKEGKKTGKSVVEVALALATEKAKSVARRFPGHVVLGADQMAEANGRWFDKPSTIKEAEQQLRTLRGQQMLLPTAVALVQGTTTLWTYSVTPIIQFRMFSEAYLQAYLLRTGESLQNIVAACAVEEEGIQLLESIEGDLFTVTGLPLFPLLAALRNLGVLGV
jgi:septum formation protein